MEKRVTASDRKLGGAWERGYVRTVCMCLSPPQIATAVYFVMIDAVTMVQLLYYVVRNQGFKGNASSLSPPPSFLHRSLPFSPPTFSPPTFSPASFSLFLFLSLPGLELPSAGHNYFFLSFN